MNLLQAILGGAVGAAFVTGAFSIIKWVLERKAAKEDRREDKKDAKEQQKDSELEEIKEEIGNLAVAMRMQMYDRIKHLGNSYLKKGFITSEELADLIEMHGVYHNTLKGNGFLDTLMEKVKALPVKG